MNDSDRLLALLRAHHPAIVISTHEEDDAEQLARDAAAALRRKTMIWTAVRGVTGGDLWNEEPAEGTENAAAAMFHMARQVNSETICIVLDVIDHLSDPRTLRAWRELVARVRELKTSAIFIDHASQVPAVVESESTRFELSLPDEKEIDGIVRRTIREHHRQKELDVAIRKEHFRTIIRNLRGLTRRQCRQIIADTVAVDRAFNEEDINHVLAQKRRILHQDGLLDYVEAPIDLSEIGGLLNLKEWLKRREASFDEKARAFGLAPPRGVLMLGVQGAGKSLCAKAIATAWKRPLLRLDPGSLYDRYVGESERRLRGALRMAEMMAPIVLWIDEIEKGFASAASHSTDGGLSKRMFGTLLTWMQEHAEPVFLVATANDIEALPPELLRKGRFDEIFFVDLPDEATRAMIFAIHLRKRGRDVEQIDLARLAQVSEGFSGAEIEQAVISALHEAHAQRTDLSTEMIERAVCNSPPLSVTMAEKVAALRRWAQGRCVPAG